MIAFVHFAPLLGVLSAVFASVQTFSRFLERYDQHRNAAVKYGYLARELEVDTGTENLARVLEEWQRVSETSPLTPSNFRN